MIEGHGDDIYRYDDLVKVNFRFRFFCIEETSDGAF